MSSEIEGFPGVLLALQQRRKPNPYTKPGGAAGYTARFAQVYGVLHPRGERHRLQWRRRPAFFTNFVFEFYLGTLQEYVNPDILEYLEVSVAVRAFQMLKFENPETLKPEKVLLILKARMVGQSHLLGCKYGYDYVCLFTSFVSYY